LSKHTSCRAESFQGHQSARPGSLSLGSFLCCFTDSFFEKSSWTPLEYDEFATFADGSFGRQDRRLHRDATMRGNNETRVLLWFGMAMLSACSHSGPVLDFGSRPPSVSGTIAGIVSTTASSIPAQNRRVTVTNLQTGARYQTVTAVDGGYTLQVPTGTYRIELALEAGEAFVRRPSDTHIGNGDLDPHRDFVLTTAQQAQQR
jgi:carboxypeptidase family protein